MKTVTRKQFSGTFPLNKSTSGRDVMKFVLTELHFAIEREINQLPVGSDYVAPSMRRIYNSIKAIGVLYGISEKELRQK